MPVGMSGRGHLLLFSPFIPKALQTACISQAEASVSEVGGVCLIFLLMRPRTKYAAVKGNAETRGARFIHKKTRQGSQGPADFFLSSARVTQPQAIQKSYITPL